MLWRIALLLTLASTVSAHADVRNTDIAWAVNIGGPAIIGSDGTRYMADTGTSGGSPGSTPTVLATQDVQLFSTHREGVEHIHRPLANGTYSAVFSFLEPKDQPIGSRVFDVYVEGQKRISGLDVRAWRDNKHHSGLTHTVVGIQVTDGALDIRFHATQGAAVLSGLVVRTDRARSDAWQLVWQDEFEANGPVDPSKWTHEIWPAGKVNDEAQVYTDSTNNARVEDGLLIIEAHKEKHGNGQYTSARLQSAGKGDFLYGRAEIRARLPRGQGTWAAIWMMPTDFYRYATTCTGNEDAHGSEVCDAWPNSGEIDIMEYVGYDQNRVHATVHTRDYYWVNWQQRKASVDGVDVEQAFHTYAVEWSPERIEVFFDGTPYFHYLNDGTGWRSWPFDHPFHIILNLAIGGNWGTAGGPIDDSIFPARMEVDYVRIFKRKTAANSIR